MKFSSLILGLGIGLAPLALAAPVPAPAPAQSAQHGDEFTALVAGITPLNGGKAPTIPIRARSNVESADSTEAFHLRLSRHRRAPVPRDLPVLADRAPLPNGAESGGPGAVGSIETISERKVHMNRVKFASSVPHRTPSAMDPRFFIFLAAVAVMTASVIIAEMRSGLITRLHTLACKDTCELDEEPEEVKMGLLDMSDDED